MADVQISVIDQQDAQVAIAVPGVQGPAGAAAYFDVAGTTYTIDEANKSRIGRFTSSSAVTVTVPSGLSANFDCMILQLGTGQITFAAGSGVTLRAALDADKSAYQYAAISLIAIGTDEYLLTGEVTP
jgi:hypothetical protein